MTGKFHINIHESKLEILRVCAWTKQNSYLEISLDNEKLELHLDKIIFMQIYRG